MKLLITSIVGGLFFELFFIGVTLARMDPDTRKRIAWSLPVYGAGGLALHYFGGTYLVDVFLIYAVEFVGGVLMSMVRCAYYREGEYYEWGPTITELFFSPPWKYTEGWHVLHLIRIDYAPWWLGVAVIFEYLRGVMT